MRFIVYFVFVVPGGVCSRLRIPPSSDKDTQKSRRYCVRARILYYFCAVKPLFATLGCVAFVLGIVGIFVPLLPTTPFLLLAAALWVRSSPRLYAWLLAHPRLGPYIRNFREKRAIPLRAKIVSVTLLWATMLYCAFALLGAWWWAQAGMVLLAAGITWHILSFATLRG